jgi:hypothetical protein
MDLLPEHGGNGLAPSRSHSRSIGHGLELQIRMRDGRYRSPSSDRLGRDFHRNRDEIRGFREEARARGACCERFIGQFSSRPTLDGADSYLRALPSFWRFVLYCGGRSEVAANRWYVSIFSVAKAQRCDTLSHGRSREMSLIRFAEVLVAERKPLRAE